jgi:p-cymene methyl-monooxygenase electron transfer component
VTLDLRITSVRRETRGTRIVRVGLGGRPFHFQAGQAALIGPAGGSECVPYSIATAPEESREQDALEFLIRMKPSGGWGNEFPPPRRGMRLAVEGPVGSFAFPPRVRDSRLLFIAGGTGVAPLRSMIQHALRTGYDGHLRMLYSARTPADFPYLRELRGMARRGEIELLLTATRETAGRWRGGRGRVTADHLVALLADGPARCFVCGPAAMVADVPAMLHALGVSRERIHVEQWGT